MKSLRTYIFEQKTPKVKIEEKEMWGSPAIVFSINKDKYFVLIGRFDEKINWHLHFENDGDKPYTTEEKDALRKAISNYIEEGDTVSSLGGCTPGGLAGIKALEAYGFEYIGDYTGEKLYWASDRLIDKDKFEQWIKDPKHKTSYIQHKDGTTNPKIPIMKKVKSGNLISGFFCLYLYIFF